MDDYRDYQVFRPLLFSLAYRMIGSVSEAEDIVQEAFLRYYRASGAGARVDSPKSYLCTVTTRLSIDHLRSARHRRETYIGSWLPEPLLAERQLGEHLLADPTADPAHQAVSDESLSLAFLVVLESLSPVERAIFLLRDVFDLEYEQIAKIVGKSEVNCRQLATRSRRHLARGKPRFEVSRERRAELADRFFAACERGDLDSLVELLASEVVMYGDGGGKAESVRQPVRGQLQVARFLLGLARQARRRSLVIRPVEVNRHPGALVLDPSGQVISVLSLEIADGRVRAVRSIVNPDKLAHLQATRE